jgi:hypothetical protein
MTELDDFLNQILARQHEADSADQRRPATAPSDDIDARPGDCVRGEGAGQARME